MAAGAGRGGEGQRHGADGIFIQALNEMIDDQEKRLTALYNRLPFIILIGCMASRSSPGFAGYAAGCRPGIHGFPST